MRAIFCLGLGLTVLAACDAWVYDDADAGAKSDAGVEPGLDSGDGDALGGDDGAEPGDDAARADQGVDSGGSRDAGRDAGGQDSALPPDAGQRWDCEISICLTGAVNRDDGSNEGFNVICDDPIIEGLVQDCAGGTCYNTFETFSVSTGYAEESIYPALFDALDSNGDGAFDDQDDDCRLNILGFSWGGATAIELAGIFLADDRVAPERAVVHRLFAMDPFRRYLSAPPPTVEIPAGVERYWGFRHSVVPESDCSTSAPFGPYKGFIPLCHPGSTCLDYDYSQEPEGFFSIIDPDYGYYGADVGHCQVPKVAHPAVLALFQDLPYDNVPAPLPVSEP